MKAKGISLPYELTYLTDSLMEDYLHDVQAVQGFAMLNREIMLSELQKKLKLKPTYFGESIHNYADENRILRKGAIAAYAGDEVIIPLNMRDGILLGTGKGNADWNFSAGTAWCRQNPQQGSNTKQPYTFGISREHARHLLAAYFRGNA